MRTQPNIAPQFEHLLFFKARQHSIPNGKKRMAHKIPRHVKSSSKMPTRHAGQAPTVIIAGGIIMFVAPQLGTKPVCGGGAPYGLYPGGGGGKGAPGGLDACGYVCG